MNTIEAINKALPIFLSNQYLEDEDLLEEVPEHEFYYVEQLAKKI